MAKVQHTDSSKANVSGTITYDVDSIRETKTVGDVIGIVDPDGTKTVTYGYSAWGTLIENSTSGTKGSKLNQYNALKYRGYYYDADLAMYYLGSRFYDTEICRFINAAIAGESAFWGTFAGSLISTDGADEFGTFFANYAIGLTTGTPAEMMSTAGQQIYSLTSTKATGKNSTRITQKNNTTCRIPIGMTTADYFRQRYCT